MISFPLTARDELRNSRERVMIALESQQRQLEERLDAVDSMRRTMEFNENLLASINDAIEQLAPVNETDAKGL